MPEPTRRFRASFAPGGRAARVRELGLHLISHEVAARQRFTLLGAAWPLARQLAQFGVLLFVFTSVVELDVENYAAFLFTGLVAWVWFSSALSQATGSLRDQRHLLFRPTCPAEVIPPVAVGVALVDALIALPALTLIVALSAGLHPTALLLIPLATIQLILLFGLAWLVSAATVYFRDVRELVTVGLMVLFYATPVFYDPSTVPGDYAWILEVNPLAILLEAYRDVLIDGTLPDLLALGALAAVAAAVAGVSLALFRKWQPGFVDEL
jgi:lipopolysaccharide transport system permease protein